MKTYFQTSFCKLEFSKLLKIQLAGGGDRQFGIKWCNRSTSMAFSSKNTETSSSH